jgi:hypothetical protein
MMKRLTSLVVLLAFLGTGCGNPSIRMPPGEDPQELVAVIGRQGQSAGPFVAVPYPPEHPVLEGAAKAAEMAGTVCLAVCGLAGLVCLAAFSRGSLSGLRPDLASNSQ